ncbi:MAG: hypothetical protein HRT81_13035 [Henriciella sp.]|nr:hypothetical protein [Henriciella sp.]
MTSPIGPGGRAALTGFLFQITRTLSQALDHSLAVRSGNIEDGDATLILEPLSGGDLKIETAQTAIVEQHKSRSTPKRWTATEIIRDVLPDLWSAAIRLKASWPTQYRIVTNGRGPTAPFHEFLKGCQFVTEPGDLPQASNLAVRAFDTHFNHRGLFYRIAETLKLDPSEHCRLLKVLQNLTVIDRLNRRDIETEIDLFLRGLTEAACDVEGKRHELIGRLFQLSSEGQTLSTVTLLDESGLPIKRLSVGVKAQARCSEKLTHDLGRYKYDRAEDIRISPPLLPETKTVLLSGESGVGKSWLLARRADELRNTKRCAIILRNIKDVDEIETALNQILWTAAGFNFRADARTILSRVQKAFPNHFAFWITIFLDDPETSCLEQIARQDWASLGVRIVVTSSRITKGEIEACFGVCALVTAPQFTLEEVKSFLVTNGPLSEIGWRSLPSDMRRLLRHPITAYLYRETTLRDTFEPRTE